MFTLFLNFYIATIKTFLLIVQLSLKNLICEYHEIQISAANTEIEVKINLTTSIHLFKIIIK